MTESEKTELAILKAKQDKKLNEKKKETKSKKVTESSVNEIQDIVNDGVDIKKYPYKLELSENKVVYYKPWTGKTKKKFRKIFMSLNPEYNDENDIDVKEIQKILIFDNLSGDIYLSESEQQYVLAEIRAKSLGQKVEFEGTCSNCGEETHIKTTLDKCIHFKANNFPQKEDIENHNVLFIDISSQKKLIELSDKILNSEDYDGLTTEGDIELALHLNIDDEDDPIKILDMIDNMELKPLKKILDKFEEYSAKTDIYVDKTCPNCGKMSKFTTTEINDLYTDLVS